MLKVASQISYPCYAEPHPTRHSGAMYIKPGGKRAVSPESRGFNQCYGTSGKTSCRLCQSRWIPAKPPVRGAAYACDAGMTSGGVRRNRVRRYILQPELSEYPLYFISYYFCLSKFLKDSVNRCALCASVVKNLPPGRFAIDSYSYSSGITRNTASQPARL